MVDMCTAVYYIPYMVCGMQTSFGPKHVRYKSGSPLKSLSQIEKYTFYLLTVQNCALETLFVWKTGKNLTTILTFRSDSFCNLFWQLRLDTISAALNLFRRNLISVQVRRFSALSACALENLTKSSISGNRRE